MPDEKEGDINAGGDSDTSEQPPPPILPPPVERDKNGEGDDDERNRGRIQKTHVKPKHWTKYVEAFCAIALVLITAYYTRAAYRQAKASETAAIAARDAVRVASRTLTETQRNNARQTELTDAARLSSQQDAQRAIKTTQDAMRLDQRAWVFATSFHLSAEPEANQPITVTMTVVNNGKTPALDAIPMTHLSNLPFEPSDVTDWDTVAKGTNKRGVISPGNVGLTVKSAPLALVNGLDAYKAGVDSIYLQAKITYWDAFNKPHWTTVCVLHHYGKPLGEFDMCERGNDVDR